MRRVTDALHCDDPRRGQRVAQRKLIALRHERIFFAADEQRGRLDA